MSILSEPRKPDCDVCDWATAYHYAHKMNLCKADFEVVTKVAESERDRIIKLLEEARDKCACYREVGMPICRHQLSVDEQIALIKGEQK